MVSNPVVFRNLLGFFCQKNAPLNLSGEWYQQRYAIDNPLDLLEFSKYEMTR